MTNQDALVFDPTREGLYDRYVTGDTIDHAAWLRATAGGDLVGTCRICGGHLAPLPAVEVTKLWCYEARCIHCGQVYLAPGGRVLRRSSRHSEQPAQWREQRARWLNERKGAS